MFNGNSGYDSLASDAVLTTDAMSLVGTFIYRSPIITDIFDVSFDFRISHNGTGPHADGMGFMLVKSDSTVAFIQSAVGAGGGGLGMVNPTASGSTVPLTGFGVELDGFDNDPMLHRCGEIAGDHINIDTLAGCQVSGITSLPSPVATAQPFGLVDGIWHTLSVQFVNGSMSVSITTGTTTTMLFSNVTIPGFTPGDSYYYGFSGATGNSYERHEIRNVSITFPTLRCL
jgi:hypothetical protein